MSGDSSDMCPFMTGSDRLVDPQDDAALWVTIEFPEDMGLTHSDERLMEFVVQQVQRHKVKIFTHAQHYQRSLCLSLPVVGVPGDEEHNDVVMAQAKTLALWWLGEIQAHRVYLDWDVIFP
ncbi:hypothetical protein N7536_009245 [Penicillium majusculum]|uniref:Uncharacterized protein n=1 Tax=Penicillium solitum TaxID=60172 RepID=A0A1V6R3A7_9EURO|nr:uncharacterized protein PENSOL_c018G08315 [Penicillium solitum]KAJ5686626.1 hypothetical protein N7536_009245 [Penicillium majusculum]OQD95905.1 hypothetical protein PENSOL_c018G08315 [Penicillium solitum]